MHAEVAHNQCCSHQASSGRIAATAMARTGRTAATAMASTGRTCCYYASCWFIVGWGYCFYYYPVLCRWLTR